MTGYTRADSVNNIADGNIINASDLDGEFDAVQAAFNSSTGHVHDGTAANGAPITKIGPTQDVVASATALTPKTTATVDVGSSSLKFKDFFFSGAGSVTGTITAGGFAGPLNGTVGATTPAAGTFTSLTASTAITLNTTTNNQSYTTTGAGTITISSGTTGTIDGMNIGVTTAGTGRFSAITNTGLTSGRVVYTTSGGLETDSAGLTFDGTNFATTGTATAAKLIPTGSSATGNGLYLPAANSVGLSTNGTNAVYIDSTQNVGIGTSSPDVKLQTNGIIKSGATGTNGEIQLARTSDGLGVGKVTMTESTQIMNYNNLLGSGVHSFTINTVERMRIDSSGNVGIGQTSPQAKLQINTAADGAQVIVVGAQTGNEQTLLFRNSFYTNNATSGIAAIGWIDSGSSGGSLTFKTGTNGGGVTNIPTERMRIDSSGNVGIGTSSPQQPLHVYSSAAAGKYIYAQQAGSYNIGFQAQNSVSNWYAYTAAGTGNFEFFQGSGSGNIVVVSPVGLGYGTGSGGTVTQATNKGTAVTLNKPTGQITMNNAALLPATEITFYLNNSLITTSDLFLVNVTVGNSSYDARVVSVNNGNALIAVKNTTAGSLSETVILNFAIIKGATS